MKRGPDHLRSYWGTGATQYVYKRIEAGKMSPRIDRTFTLSEIVNAHRYMEKNQQIGKIVVIV
jgi:NADPH:quinone reductase-like Zn-dependent oxidoreductase